MLVGEMLTVVRDPLKPLPVRFTMCGLPLALSLIVTVPFCVPVDVGLNVTLMVQFAPAATEAPQVLV